ncbi:proline-rich transmembrane protein 1-like [Glandiceps talaboti]
MSFNEPESNKLLEEEPFKRVQFYDANPAAPGPHYQAASFTGVTEPPSSPSMITYSQPLPIWRIPSDHFILAVVTTVLCFWPVGIFALWKSREVYRCASRGDMEGAWYASNAARMLSWAALVVGLIIFIIAMIIVILEHDEIEFDD